MEIVANKVEIRCTRKKPDLIKIFTCQEREAEADINCLPWLGAHCPWLAEMECSVPSIYLTKVQLNPKLKEKYICMSFM